MVRFQFGSIAHTQNVELPSLPFMDKTTKVIAFEIRAEAITSNSYKKDHSTISYTHMNARTNILSYCCLPNYIAFT